MKKQTKYDMTLSEMMDMLRMGVRAVTRGYKQSRAILGSAGIGKSFAVLDELRSEEVDFVHITGGIKDSKAFYLTLCKHNDPNKVIVFDDTNDLIRKRQNVEILRAAVTNEPERHISYFETHKLLMDGLKTYKPQIVFTSKIIIVTNIPKHKIDPAIVSRTSPIEIIVDKFQMADYIEANLENAPPRGVDIEWKKEAWNYITKELGLKNIRHLDFRVFEDVMLWVASCKDKDAHTSDWKKFAYSILV